MEVLTNIGGTCIDAVLHQLFHGCRKSQNNLTRADLVNWMFINSLDGSSWFIAEGRRKSLTLNINSIASGWLIINMQLYLQLHEMSTFCVTKLWLMHCLRYNNSTSICFQRKLRHMWLHTVENKTLTYQLSIILLLWKFQRLYHTNFAGCFHGSCPIT